MSVGWSVCQVGLKISFMNEFGGTSSAGVPAIAMDFNRLLIPFLGNEGKNLANFMTNICTMNLKVLVTRIAIFIKYKKLSCSFLYHSLTQNIPNFINPKQSFITDGLSS